MDRFNEFLERAARYRRMLRTVEDPRTRDVLAQLAKQYEAAAEAEASGGELNQSAQQAKSADAQ